jgi:hypothetical protein
MDFVVEVLEDIVWNAQSGGVVLTLDSLKGAEVTKAGSVSCDTDDVLDEGLVRVILEEVRPVVRKEGGSWSEVFGTGGICLKREFGVRPSRRGRGGWPRRG